MTRLLFLACLLWPAIGLAADPLEPTKIELQYQGQDGIWFRLDTARRMLGDLRALPAYRERVELLEHNLRLHEGLIETHERVTKLAQREATEATRVLETAVTGEKQCEAELRSWQRNPQLWFMLGVLTATIAFGIGVSVMIAN